MRTLSVRARPCVFVYCSDIVQTLTATRCAISSETSSLALSSSDTESPSSLMGSRMHLRPTFLCMSGMLSCKPTTLLGRGSVGPSTRPSLFRARIYSVYRVEYGHKAEVCAPSHSASCPPTSAAYRSVSGCSTSVSSCLRSAWITRKTSLSSCKARSGAYNSCIMLHG
jgi:hypothetical protein